MKDDQKINQHERSPSHNIRRHLTSVVETESLSKLRTYELVQSLLLNKSNP